MFLVVNYDLDMYRALVRNDLITSIQSSGVFQTSHF